MSTTNDPALSGTSEQIVAMFATYERARDARDRLRAEGVPEADLHLLNAAAGETDSTFAYDRTQEGFWGALKRLFVPEEHAYGYAEGLRRGQAMLSVRPPPGMRDRVIETLESFDPIDFEAQEAEWRNAGWSGHGAMGRSGMDRPAREPGEVPTSAAETAALADSGAMSATSELAGTKEPVAPVASTAGTAGTLGTTRPVGAGESRESIPVVEEELAVGKREVSRGRVRVRSYMTERPVEQDVTLRDERVHVERRPVDRPAGTLPEDAFRERTIEVAATGEEAVVSKEARVVEEVVVSKDQTERTETVRDTVRKTDVEVEDDGTSRPADRKPLP